ncbi:hypothetical protein P9273_29530 [Mesorhizobium sp. WSM4935]|uniref:hypothetical protein n=1 Tax=Mesorhizobium sp. WSM4935 TaxID=3038547 RepID=UPI002415717A|nr:hypothetical protein [Mesorhizobium sp. WSM4935]MDG4879223.1 hypothetical protein [Mesorhizobium sp. WSM4935]
MTSYAHKTIAETILAADRVPDDAGAFDKWIRAGRHLDDLQANARSDELIIYASGPYSFVYSIAVPADALAADGPEALLHWDANPYTSIASYASGGGRDTMWIERENHRGSPALDAGIDLIFGRTFEGWSGPGRTYFEANQEYTHLSGIHWRSERSAYCRFDRNGDLADIVSITVEHKKRNDLSLVTFSWSDLEEYLAIAGYVLVRMFDFTLLRYGGFSGWSDGPEEVVRVSDDFLYRQKAQAGAAYTRGVQIIRPRDARTVSENVSGRWFGSSERDYVSFIAQDWRNNKIAEISTDPAATTNYFEAGGNDMPYELSPAFFRPEVLSKYKTDREKYTVHERDIDCRTSWTLRGYDVNDAGQVFAYICYLRNLPFNEQLHWKSFNEPPKASISERAYINDFKGEYVTFRHPRAETLSILARWRESEVGWWTLRDEDLLDRANPPISSSKDEWAEAIMDLSKLVVEGFDTKSLRSALDKVSEPYTREEKSIALLEKLVALKSPDGGSVLLEGLRAVQYIRSKVKGHSGSSEGKAIVQDVLTQHGTYAEHFKQLCALIVYDLRRIESALS